MGLSITKPAPAAAPGNLDLMRRVFAGNGARSAPTIVRSNTDPKGLPEQSNIDGGTTTLVAYETPTAGLFHEIRFKAPNVGVQRRLADWLSRRYASAGSKDPGVGESGAMFDWTPVPPSAPYNGVTRRSTVAGDFFTYTTPAATYLGLGFSAITNTGVVMVEIDGSKTAANLLPTADDLVAKGALSAGDLVTAGLVGTERVLDCYGPSHDSFSLAYGTHLGIAEGLANTAHTIKVTTLGVKNPNSSDIRFYLERFSWGSATGTIERHRQLNSLTSSAFEMACLTNGTNWAGASHGNELLLEWIPGLYRRSSLTDGTKYAETETTYDYSDGAITTTTTITFTRSIPVDRCYIGMRPTEATQLGIVDRWRFLESQTVNTLSGASGISGLSPSAGIVAWRDGGQYGMLMTVEDSPLWPGLSAPLLLGQEDRAIASAGSQLTKFYPAHLVLTTATAGQTVTRTVREQILAAGDGRNISDLVLL